MVTVRLLIRGRVHGVFFRHTTRERARELGLNGWVRNLENGMVEIEAAGGKEAVDQLIAWCHQGPPSAQVERVEATWLKGQEKSQSSLNRTAEGFEIR